MRPLALVPFVAVLLFAATGCDLMTDVDGPRPEDFQVDSDTSEVRATEPNESVHQGELRQDVASPLTSARGGVTLSLRAQVTPGN